ncbi:ATP-binding cassette domain-containing protein [Aerophototrophica crusticola]|uniref:ATP-binding cassette domain-containing protein n=1 Tax=Aerophototrophica crusticola TaxID=1709002 RepID=A0A858RAN2_9PROT|nr:ATP-binding cassette domain-containing protein [Rhodospirillaceae bacterium B3]
MRATPSLLPLALDRVGFRVGGDWLVRDMSFSVAGTGRTLLLGPNGAGKSVTLRLCHGLLSPTEGTVRWAAGQPCPPGPGRHAMVFQKPVLLRRSARENLLHALSLAGLHAQAAGERADMALERFQLAPLAHRPARVLSGGEQQRLAIARAWAVQPQLLFLDEPTSHLDPASTRAIELALDLFRAEGTAVLMTTHDLAQARRLADRVLFLHRGRLLEDRPAAAFFTDPHTREAAAYLRGELLD